MASEVFVRYNANGTYLTDETLGSLLVVFPANVLTRSEVLSVSVYANLGPKVHGLKINGTSVHPLPGGTLLIFVRKDTFALVTQDPSDPSDQGTWCYTEKVGSKEKLGMTTALEEYRRMTRTQPPQVEATRAEPVVPAVDEIVAAVIKRLPKAGLLQAEAVKVEPVGLSQAAKVQPGAIAPDDFACFLEALKNHLKAEKPVQQKSADTLPAPQKNCWDGITRVDIQQAVAVLLVVWLMTCFGTDSGHRPPVVVAELPRAAVAVDNHPPSTAMALHNPDAAALQKAEQRAEIFMEQYFELIKARTDNAATKEPKDRPAETHSDNAAAKESKGVASPVTAWSQFCSLVGIVSSTLIAFYCLSFTVEYFRGGKKNRDRRRRAITDTGP